MPVKSPPKGSASGNTHVRHPLSPDVNTVRPDAPPRLGFELLPSADNPLRSLGTATDLDIEAIRPAPIITVQPTTFTADALRPVYQPLEDYRLSPALGLSAVDAEGLRTHKGRQYVDVAGERIVLIGKDPDTGLYRARLPSESKPSGPVMLRDPGTGLWHELDDFAPVTFALSSTRLEDFRTALDFGDAVPDSDGLHRFNDKLYAVIGHHGYQVLHDLDASSPLADVMRIVRSEDPVASDSDNVYVASRPGRSEPIVFNAQEGWRGTEVGGTGGMLRGESASSAHPGLLERLSHAVNQLRPPESRARKLFPSLNNEEIATLLRSQGDDVRSYLTRREAEYKHLKVELLAWLKKTALPGETENPSVVRAVEEIKRCWRRQTGTTLKLELGGAIIAPLTADFSHVRSLQLTAVTWSDTADTFLGGFSAIERLAVTHSTLEKLPAHVAQMPDLSALDLSANRIQLNAPMAAILSTLGKLQSLDLSGNPLGKTPDFSSLSELKEVNLSNTQLDHWPVGLQDQTGLDIIDLRNNQLREIAPANLNPPSDQLLSVARINAVTLIEGNPFPASYWRTLEVYWRRVIAQYPAMRTGNRADAFRLYGDIPEVAMVRRMYPDKDLQAAREYLIGLGDDAETDIARRIQDFDVLETQLATYIADSQPGTSSVVGPQKMKAELVARIIKGCWLRESAGELKLPPMYGPLPAVTVDFSHVRLLTLDSVVWTDTADTLLSNCANLESLTIVRSGIETLPGKVAEMDKLSQLNLNANRLKLDEQSAAALSALHRLSQIDLSDNPLQLLPDFSRMSGLQTLNLKNTGITQWPTGLLDKAELTRLDLRNNRLREVPQANLNPAPEALSVVARINNVTRLDDNDFPSAYWRKFDAYWRRLKETHPELMDPADAAVFDSENSRAQRYRNLYPAKSIKECRDFIWNHDKATVVPHLLALEQEFDLLKSQLDDWVFSGGGNRLRYVRANQLQINAMTRNDRTAARDRIIHCWRRETAQKHANDGTPIGLELDLSGLTLPTLPDLSIDFSHVGSLRLSGMNLTASPEGFLTRFRHVRWLDMSNNRLRDLPPAVGEMHGMTRLFLQHNQLELNAEAARILAGRTTLRALWIDNNPQLGVIPDFSQITDMREVNLANTGISQWPTGLFDQPLLTGIDLSNNRITTIPEFVAAPPPERLAHSVQVNSGTLVSNNPLSDATPLQLLAYQERLRLAGTPLNRRPNLITTSVSAVRRTMATGILEPDPRWTAGLTVEQATARTAQWRALREQEGSEGFFNILANRIHHRDFRRQAWDVIDVISENNPQSRSLRRELFDRACEAGCTDLAAATFTDLQVLAMTHKARVQARQDMNGAPLVELSNGLFRLKHVDAIAAAEIASSRAIVNDSATSPQLQNTHRLRIRDPHEMTMAYRFGLKDRLQLPFQPQSLSFIGMAGVTPAMLDVAYQKVIALNGSPEEFQALVSMDFWQDFIIHKYQAQFDASRQPFQDRQEVLDGQSAQRLLSEAQYNSQTDDVTAQLAIVEATLIQTLTRQELQPRTSIEASSANFTPADETPGASGATV
ncbi:NEL-type E3 ubiquitin ligase domain-containing protein [Pseudomonas sp. B33.4]|uniref:NEL-type E3 ubiquitin ligase domain-containing protein n=1 Tax=Pseudomonas sp. B33.4 TaxID=3104265 RepID=UPI002ADEAB92|nr:NEL-type E3 ubiquitin ligase domain-containing protein [Pseudomonas sp. B33.4]